MDCSQCIRAMLVVSISGIGLCVQLKDQNIGNYGLSVLGFYGYIGNIDEYYDKSIGKVKINKNTLKFLEILC